MHEPSTPVLAPEGPAASPATSIDRQIAAQDVVIAGLQQRLANAAGKRARFSYRALYAELSLEAELSAARDVRGALLYDRNFAGQQH